MPPGIGRWPNLKEHGKLPQQVIVRSSKYLNNLIEQDHRRIKQRLRPMLGLESFSTAAVVISGIALAEKIRKRAIPNPKAGRSNRKNAEDLASCHCSITSNILTSMININSTRSV